MSAGLRDRDVLRMREPVGAFARESRKKSLSAAEKRRHVAPRQGAGVLRVAQPMRALEIPVSAGAAQNAMVAAGAGAGDLGRAPPGGILVGTIRAARYGHVKFTG